VSGEHGVQAGTWWLLATVSGGCRCDACVQARLHAEYQIADGPLCECDECELARAWLDDPYLPNACEGQEGFDGRGTAP
jgi:hypothetical protein